MDLRVIVSSTHLRTPVMIERTESLALATHILCWSWGMYFSAAPPSENQRQHDLLRNRRRLDYAVEGSGHPAHDRMLHPALDRGEGFARYSFEPLAIQGFGDHPELDDAVAWMSSAETSAAFLRATGTPGLSSSPMNNRHASRR